MYCTLQYACTNQREESRKLSAWAHSGDSFVEGKKPTCWLNHVCMDKQIVLEYAFHFGTLNWCVFVFFGCKFSLMHSRLGFKADFFFGICCYTPCWHSCPSLPKMYVGNIKARSPAFPASNTFLVPLMSTQIAPGWVMNIGYNALVLLKNPPFISTRFC